MTYFLIITVSCRAREQYAAYNRLNERFSQHATEKFPETAITPSIESANPPVSLNAVGTEKDFSVLAEGEQDAVLSLLNLSNPVSHPRTTEQQSTATPPVPVQNLQNLVTTLMVSKMFQECCRWWSNTLIVGGSST